MAAQDCCPGPGPLWAQRSIFATTQSACRSAHRALLGCQNSCPEILGPHWAYQSQRCPCRLQTFWNLVLIPIWPRGVWPWTWRQIPPACSRVWPVSKSPLRCNINTPQAQDFTSSADSLQWHQLDLRSQSSWGCTFCRELFTRQPITKSACKLTEHYIALLSLACITPIR